MVTLDTAILSRYTYSSKKPSERDAANSAALDATKAVDSFMDLTNRNIDSIELSPEAFDAFRKILSNLVRHGIYGEVSYDLRGERYSRDLSVDIGDERTRGLDPYRPPIPLG